MDRLVGRLMQPLWLRVIPISIPIPIPIPADGETVKRNAATC